MPDSAQVRSAVDAAEQAATAGDFIAAARHLRDALALQERELGPGHPDLASTLNNLGVVSERTGDFAEAERCYRRACAIVSAAFPAEHPFVETTRQNLAAFCEARSVPVEKTADPEPAPPRAPEIAPPAITPPPAVSPAPTPPSPPPIATSPAPIVTTPAPRPAGEQRSGRLPLVPIAAAAVIVIGLVLWINRGGAGTSGPASSASASSPPAATPASSTSTSSAASATPTVAPAPPPSAPRESPPAAKAANPASSRGATAAAPATALPARASGPGGSTAVVDAQVCRTLTRGAEWTCARAGDPVTPGHLYFYTRVTTPRDTVIVHRWYRDDRVQLNRELQIGANSGAGYRTYSHLVVDAKSAGQWRVELRTADGRVLREERFVVR